ncbi:EAL domain-containing protein [Novosphingobium sp. SL115]|uniref:putative bifunctional diguanylate cyclase/phosphodiesterase n=1 Tax=Novosphingobium sp. SL115 TaxID=2995150 RepID=UPI002274FF1C|nr:EAL domain-containing protein [Novosphingobium sp. SL115]MCY1669713.1 EAL domain-containing protein [Novosphingobium sp. SL115]
MHDHAPAPLVYSGCLAFSAFSLWRAVYWLPSRVGVRSLETLRRDLKMMSRVGSAAAFVFGLWVMMLHSYGDVLTQSFLHYMVAVAMFSGILGLGHSPLTALRIAIAIMLPFSAQVLFSGHPNAVPVVLVQGSITTLLLMIANGHHRDFVRLELSRQQLVRREREAARLAQANHLQATVDPLTGALNRRAILLRLEQELVGNRHGHGAAWLALIDLDGFKHINDTYGHAAGDAVLAAVAARLADVVQVKACGRLGGDEFAAIIDASLDEEAVRALAMDMSESLRARVCHGGAVLRFSGSIGIHRVAGRTASDSLERADAALYKAKEQGDGAVVVFTPEDEVELQARAAITRLFNDSELDKHIRLVYQPIIDIESGRTTGFEAFVRWSPDGEAWLMPGKFMHLAEATGRTGELTRMVLARALAECRAWEQGRTLSINLSPRDVTRAGTAEALARIVRDAGAPPQSIVLEVTERALLGDPKRADAQLRAFRQQGFRIALDDFGAGWSSLSQVHRLPLDMIKIDQGLSRALATDPGARALVGTIISLSWQLGIDCTIEGVEDQAQADTARALGVRLMQGYHFGRPEPIEALLAKVANVA